jgi:hypothetical protein
MNNKGYIPFVSKSNLGNEKDYSLVSLEASRNKNTAIVTFVVGKKYLESFNETFGPSIRQYAKKIGREFVSVSDFIVPTSKHPSWQKLMIFKSELLSGYDRVLIVDGDIYITRHAKDIFEVIGERPWGIVKNNPYDLASFAKSDLTLYKYCPLENRPDFVVNGGMFMISREYQHGLEKIFHTQEEQVCYEQGPLSYFLLNDARGVVLPPLFNTVVSSYIEAYGCGLSVVLRMYDEASFLHFAASKWRSLFIFIRWFDTTDSDVAKKIVRFFGQKKFDFLTAPLITLLQRMMGSYTYRFKKYFS